MAENHDIKELYQDVRSRLQAGGVDSPDIAARVILKNTINIADVNLISDTIVPVSQEVIDNTHSCVDRHINGEPVSRIFGQREFWSLSFNITPDVLDPRPDTELVVETALKRFVHKRPLDILDLGTGSGCIIISLLHEWKDCQGLGADVSKKALDVAKQNGEKNGVGGRLKLVHSDWFEKINPRPYDLIVANPPYISNQDIESLPAGVRNHDPILALDGGNDGLDAYKKIISTLPRYLDTEGICLLEIGFDQAEKVTRLVEESNLSVKDVHADLAGNPRVVEISFGEK